MTTRLILVRHGETGWNQEQRIQGQTDAPLNDLGREQALQLRERLSREPLAAIYTSDLVRAMETALCIAEAHGLPVHPVPALREAHFGDWEGLSMAEIRQRWEGDFRQWLREPHLFRIPNGEALDKVADRATAAVRSLIEKHVDATIAVVGHGGSLRTALLTLLEIPLSAFRRFWLDNGSVSILQLKKGYARLVSLNETWHLDGLKG